MAGSSRSSEKRRRILDAGSALFSRRGFSSTTLEDIARKARMGKATLYYYFPEGKETIFAAVVQHEVDTLFGRLMEEMGGTDNPVDRLCAYLRARIKYFHDKMDSHGMTPGILGELMPRAEVELRRYLGLELEALAALVDEGIRRGGIRPVNSHLTARVLQASLRGLTSDGPIPVEPEQRRRESDEFLAFVLQGLAAPPQGEP